MRLLLSFCVASSLALGACGTIPGYYPPETYEEAEGEAEDSENPPAPPATITPEVFSPSGSVAQVTGPAPSSAELKAYEHIFAQLYCDRTGQSTGTPEALITAGGLTQARYTEIQASYQADSKAWADLLTRTYESCP